ncbi:pepsin-like aspartic protease [Aspergillus puulaauensis]|uniref:Peptidase A1 domain-containing protein n=1 Tax=Aspergillus puulaauensis TaxID=1220207 RepID=A0A7R8AIX5_9EURO|nr:uncharacterized protein APUU_21621A [Aspergillus puulaauensis]BCS21189.1 hypothetical protein APUU_21621A [Aspergillus puulaauensis]
MRIFLLSSLAALAVPGLCALSVHESDSPHVLQLGLKRNRHDDPVGRDRKRWKRQTVNVGLYGDSMGGDIYSTNLTLGSPPQRVEVSVDTGSSDLWVVYSDNDICDVEGARCDSFGTYDPRDSKNANTLSDRFSIQYGDSSWAEGHYAVDSLVIEDAEVPKAQFAVAMTSGIDKGILGIGYPANEVARKMYPNLPELLVTNNITASSAYSLWLNRLGEDEGTILFGGVNTAHYTGSLQTVPVVPYSNQYVHLWITLTELSASSEKDSIHHSFPTDSLPLAVLLDSGSTLTYLPAPLVKSIYSALDVHFYEEAQVGYVPCNSYLTEREDYNLTFSFNGAKVSVPLSELVLQDSLHYTDDALHINGEQSCTFGILPSADFFPILGDTFLRSAYVVFDLDNNEVSLAQAKYNPDEDKILEIGDGDDSVPHATPVDDPVTTASVTTGGASLVLPTGFTNSPIFPSRTASATASATAVVDATDTGSGGDDSDSDDEDTPGNGAGVGRGVNSLLGAGVVGVGLFLAL